MLDDQRRQAQSARDAAEALFRPKGGTTPADGAPTTTTEAPAPRPEQEAPRKPRILSATGAAPVPAVGSGLVASTGSTPKPIAPRRMARSIPTSAYGRVRALVTYGMTADEVADLYGVPASDVERIVSKSGRSEASIDSAD